MAWTTARTWVSGELVDETILNTHIRDNLNALKTPPTDFSLSAAGSDYTESSSTFNDIDATNLSATITTTGGDILVGFCGSVFQSGSGKQYWDILDNGVSVTGDSNGIGLVANTSYEGLASFVYLIESPSAGSHTIKLQWRVTAGTGTLESTTGQETPQLWVKEL